MLDENALISTDGTFVFDFGNVYFRCLSGSYIKNSATDVFFPTQTVLKVSQLKLPRKIKALFKVFNQIVLLSTYFRIRFKITHDHKAWPASSNTQFPESVILMRPSNSLFP